ncbi:hypothetical protein FRC02_003404 [Tulasnella sp. 418]|nr:hypothetical protein FRC02_003404 [Tulasnella sp. 418]
MGWKGRVSSARSLTLHSLDLIFQTMSAANAPVTGDVLLIPDPSTVGTSAKRVTIEWSQGWSTRTAEYYTFFAHNKSKNNAEVLIYVSAEKFTHDHFSGIATLVGDNYELTIDNKLQYGQKNKIGEQRFIVYHDKERKPFQHRFIESAAANQLGNLAVHIAQYFGKPDVGSLVATYGKAAFGDSLHDYN